MRRQMTIDNGHLFNIILDNIILYIQFLIVDTPKDFSHHSRSHGFCRHKRIVPHHVFLEGGRRVSIFRKLATGMSSSKECNEYCCQQEGCSLAFIMRNKCYGVMCADNGDCESNGEERLPLHLEIAWLQRKGTLYIFKYS